MYQDCGHPGPEDCRILKGFNRMKALQYRFLHNFQRGILIAGMQVCHPVQITFMYCYKFTIGVDTAPDCFSNQSDIRGSFYFFHFVPPCKLQVLCEP